MNILGKYSIAASVALLFMSEVSMAQGNTNVMDQAQPQGAPAGYVNSTWQPSLVPDGIMDRVPHINRVLPWRLPREADVMYSKRVWREIDTRQKQNMPFRWRGDDASGGGMFIEILLDGVKKGKLKAYSTMDDRFTTALTKEQITEMLTGTTDTQRVENPETGEITIKIVHNEFNPDVVTRFRIKEDVVFDRNIGRMVTRIIGLAPLRDIYNEDGSYRATTPMFWMYYPEMRETLAQYEVFNPENDVARMTWDEFFENRYFSSYVIKTSNPLDATLQQMGLSGTDLLYEGQRIQEELFNKEHDMWVY